MDIKKEKLEIECPNCKKKFLLTFNTINCPHCGMHFDQEEVHQVFYNYESKLVNSKAYKTGERFKKTGETMQKTGGALQQIGCFLFLLPLAVLCIWFLINLF
ncbi:zinc ribbon domain-containing protein [Enterococcus hulanensis]|uniref:zinc ribbon domain-containing protein n=1 Tax=Enterococcus hulanensis TaxID=2559929 RepID=UPI00288D0458|nr:zinc ribbon domain-containing protein [Enterococcus hulanensis]MDT2661068.1 zinc ribbon domain-containing protein [Enterococcus hulanensis]